MCRHMPKLVETLDRLVSSFANDVMTLIRNGQIEELIHLTAPGTTVTAPLKKTTAATRAKADAPTSTVASRGKNGRGQAAPRTPQAPRTQSKPARTRRAAAAPVVPDAASLQTAIAYFAARGGKGATAYQLAEHLAAQGIAASGASVTELLLQQGAIRDAGFRRTTGKGTAPVFVPAS